MKRILAIGIILLFIGMSISSSTGVNVEKQSTTPRNGKTLYVGGFGPNNYTRIQDAINDASDGDTVFVFDDSGPFYENLDVNKSITLKGEDKETTIINGNDSEIVINISSDNVILSGFTILNHGNCPFISKIIYIQSNFNVISGNIINANDDYGININYSEFTTISGNIMTGNTTTSWWGIWIFEGKNNNISRNIIKNFDCGIVFGYSNNYSIYRNTIIDNLFGLGTAGFSINDVISLNNISDNFYGISAFNCFNYKIIKNNFMGNRINAGFSYRLYELFDFGLKYESIRNIRSSVKWDGNYWNRPRSFPKFIFGQYGVIRFFQFDWHPVSEPYDIEV